MKGASPVLRGAQWQSERPMAIRATPATNRASAKQATRSITLRVLRLLARRAFLATPKKDISAGPRWSVIGSYLAITAQLRPATMSHMLTLAGLREDIVVG